MDNYQKLLDKLLEDPDFRAGYDAKPQFVNLGLALRRAREAVHVSQKALSEKSGVAQSDISRLDAGLGTKGPTFDTLLRLARALGMDLSVNFVAKNQFPVDVPIPQGYPHESST